MGENFIRTSWDCHGCSTTTYNNADGRAKVNDPDLAALRISQALFGWKQFVPPGEIKTGKDVSLRMKDLRGNFAGIVRRVIGHQTDKRTANTLRDTIGFTQGKPGKVTAPPGQEETAEETAEGAGLYMYILSTNFYLTRLPFIEALNIFIKTITTIYLRELLRRYPTCSETRARIAGMDEQRLEEIMREHDLSKSPLPLNYDLSPLPDKSLTTLDSFIEGDEITFSANYVNSLYERTNGNLKEMTRLSRLSEEDLKDLIKRFPR